MEGEIYAIVVMNLKSKIFFCQKKSEYPLDDVLKLTKNVSKTVKTNYLQDYLSKQMEHRLLDTLMSPTVKVKLSLLWETCVIMFYSPSIDLYLLNLYNQRMIESLYLICKTKKIKIEMLTKNYHDVNQVLIDTIYCLNPKERINAKLSGNKYLVDDMIGHNIFFQKFNRSSGQMKSMAYLLSSKNFIKTKGELQYIKKQNENICNLKFKVDDYILSQNAHKKNNLLRSYGVKTLLKEKNIDYNNETSSKIKHLKNKVESKDNTNQIKNNLKISISPEMNFQTTNAKLFKNELELNNNKETKYMSTTPNIPPKKKEEMELQVSINSLNKVDINSVINSLNFDFDHYTESAKDKKEVNNTNKEEEAKNANTNAFDFSFPPVNTINNAQKTDINNIDKQNENIINNIDFFNMIPQNNSTNAIQNSSTNNPKHFPSFHFPEPKNNPVTTSPQPTQPLFNFELPKPSPKVNIDILTEQNKQKEDYFDPETISKKVRCCIFETGMFIQGRGSNESRYRGQILLELKSGFTINQKTLYLHINHPDWTNNIYFNKEKNNAIVSKDNNDNYELTCRNIKTNQQRILEYTPSQSKVNLPVTCSVNCRLNEGHYELRIACKYDTSITKNFGVPQMSIVIVTKQNSSEPIGIIRTNNANYTMDAKAITYRIDNFANLDSYGITILFESPEKDYVELVKIDYRYMGLLPTRIKGDISYHDEKGKSLPLRLADKCQVEHTFYPEM